MWTVSLRRPLPRLTPVGSDWHQNVMPLLLAAAALERGLAPGAGVTQDALNAALGRVPGDAQTSTTLVQLSAAGYLRDEQSVEQIDAPIFFRLGERALQRVAGWPGASGDLAGDARIDRPATRGPRSPTMSAGGSNACAPPPNSC